MATKKAKTKAKSTKVVAKSKELPKAATKKTTVKPTKEQPVAAKKTEKTEKKSLLASVPFLNRSSDASGSSKTSDAQWTRKLSQRKVILPFLFLLIILLFAYLFLKYSVVAWVNNKPITTFQMDGLLEDKYKKDAREELIIQKLTEDEAAKRNVSVTTQEVNNEINRIQNLQGGQAQLQQFLDSQRIGPKEFKDLVRLQLLRQKMFGNDIQVSNADIDKYLQDNKAMLPEVSPNDASAAAQQRETAKEQIIQEKSQTNYKNWLDSVINSKQVSRQNF